VFNVIKETSAVVSGNDAPGYTQADVLRVSTSSHKIAKPPTIEGVNGQKHHGVIRGTKLFGDENGSTGWHEGQTKCPEGIFHCKEYDRSLRSMGVRDGIVATDHSQRSERERQACTLHPLLMRMRATEMAYQPMNIMR
jgi:hypothetical protein